MILASKQNKDNFLKSTEMNIFKIGKYVDVSM